MHMGLQAASPAPAERDRRFIDGACEMLRSDGDVWRYDPSDRLSEIRHADGSATVFDENGATLHFNRSGDLIWSIGLDLEN